MRATALPGWLALLVLCALPASGSVAAQVSGTLLAGPGSTASVPTVKFEFQMAARVRRPGGTGWVSGVLTNRDSRPHRIEVLAGSSGYAGSDYGARFVATLEPGASTDVLLPVPFTGAGFALLTLGTGNHTDSRQLEGKGDAHIGLLVVAEGSRGESLGRALAQAANDLQRPRLASPAEEPDVVPPDWLPPRWTLLSGFDVILLDSALDAGQQRVIVDAVSAGARLLMTERALAALPAGPLQERLARLRDARRLTWGFGSVRYFDGAELPTARALEVLLDDTGAGTLTSGLPFDALLLPLRLTKLIAVPTSSFALVVLGYVLLLAVLMTRELRRRTPLRLLAVLPVTGCALTAVVLGGGLLLEGTSMRGASRSLALLDQETHEAVVTGGRTLYAGLGSSSAQPGSGTQVVPLAALSGDSGGLMQNAHQGGRLDAELLPARTPVSLALTSVGPSRERLLVRAEADGSLRLVAEESFRPVATSGSVVLRLPDGRGFFADEGGLLHAVDDAALHESMSALLKAFIDAPLLTRATFGETWKASALVLPDDVVFDSAHIRNELREQVHELQMAGLAPGSYLARVQDGVLLDDLELDIDAESQDVHLVLGHFAPGDVP